jgi:hypothetical protein
LHGEGILLGLLGGLLGDDLGGGGGPLHGEGLLLGLLDGLLGGDEALNSLDAVRARAKPSR